MKLLSFRLVQSGTAEVMAVPVAVENTLGTPVVAATRARQGEYIVTLGDDILDPSQCTVQATLALGTGAALVEADVTDVNVVEIHTFTESRVPIDLNGLCFITLIAKS